MRELIFKNLTKASSNKRDISVEEIVERDGLVSSTKKRSMYFIRGIHRVKSRMDLEEWINQRKENLRLNRKFFHILRRYSDSTNEDMLICKMRGCFYVICGESVYNIIFVHAIKIKLQKA